MLWFAALPAMASAVGSALTGFGAVGDQAQSTAKKLARDLRAAKKAKKRAEKKAEKAEADAVKVMAMNRTRAIRLTAKTAKRNRAIAIAAGLGAVAVAGAVVAAKRL